MLWSTIMSNPETLCRQIEKKGTKGLRAFLDVRIVRALASTQRNEAPADVCEIVKAAQKNVAGGCATKNRRIELLSFLVLQRNAERAL